MKYFHGTTTENYFKILKQKKLITSYFDEQGIYISDDYYHASMFGEVVFIFDDKQLDKSNFCIDDVNDGIFYKNGIEFSAHSILVQSSVISHLGYHWLEFVDFQNHFDIIYLDVVNNKIDNVCLLNHPIKFE